MWKFTLDLCFYVPLATSLSLFTLLTGGMIWENGIETCILSSKNRIASLCPMQDTACLGLVHGDDPEGCYGEGGGRGFMFRNACAPVVDSNQCMAKPIQYCKAK